MINALKLRGVQVAGLVGAGLAMMSGVGATSQFATADSTIVTLFADLTTSATAIVAASVALGMIVYLIYFALRKGKKNLHGRV